MNYSGSVWLIRKSSRRKMFTESCLAGECKVLDSTNVDGLLQEVYILHLELRCCEEAKDEIKSNDKKAR
jgi:hypothetical protein